MRRMHPRQPLILLLGLALAVAISVSVAWWVQGDSADPASTALVEPPPTYAPLEFCPWGGGGPMKIDTEDSAGYPIAHDGSGYGPARPLIWPEGTTRTVADGAVSLVMPDGRTISDGATLEGFTFCVGDPEFFVVDFEGVRPAP
jgi:hypothetical protein